MATIASPSSLHHHNDNDDDDIPTAIPSVSATAASSRRLPPPCWSPEETVALIDAYKSKWYSLRRGNLRANHWQEVADDIAVRSPANPPKTAVQCRHKMEKLRKRYRAEIQRAAAQGGVRRYRSSWVHFQKMHSMEKGPNPTPPSSSDDASDADDEIDQKNSIKRINDLYNRNQKFNFESNNPASGVRIKFPGQSTAPPPSYPKFDQIGGQYSFPIPKSNPNPRFPNPISTPNGAILNKPKNEGFYSRPEMGNRAGEILKNSNVDEVVGAIQAMGEGFMRVEKAKMDMVKQIEEMRMEMELKRTEMILESQQRIVETFAKAMTERSSKRAKKDSTNGGC